MRRDAAPYLTGDHGLASAQEIEESYDHVIIATGSRPFIPPMEGFGLPGTFAFRTLDDCARIADYAQDCKRAAVIGGGLLGLEAARGLLTHNVEVTVVEAAPQLMIAQLDRRARCSRPRWKAWACVLLEDHDEDRTRDETRDSIPEATQTCDCNRNLAVRISHPRSKTAPLRTDMVSSRGDPADHGGCVGVGGSPWTKQLLPTIRCTNGQHLRGWNAQHRGRIYGLVDPI